MPVFDGKDPTPAVQRETVKLTVHVPRPLRDAFASVARAEGWKMAKAIRLLMERVVGDAPSGPVAPGSARKITLRVRDEARAVLLEQAAGQHTSPPAWATALLESALLGAGRPVWGKREAEELRALYLELKAVERASSDPAVLDAIRPAMLRVARNIGRLERKSG